MSGDRPASGIDDETVARVARLSRLELTDEERVVFRAQLAGILEAFQRVAALDLPAADEAAPATAPPDAALRDDEVTPSLPREEALANAPETEDGYFVVPPVIDTDGAG
jgi:aspartyl-tRNA(Asn)/glutamyl-tRNA(Gln) amidotransferase subunit C